MIRIDVGVGTRSQIVKSTPAIDNSKSLLLKSGPSVDRALERATNESQRSVVLLSLRFGEILHGYLREYACPVMVRRISVQA